MLKIVVCQVCLHKRPFLKSHVRLYFELLIEKRLLNLLFLFIGLTNMKCYVVVLSASNWNGWRTSQPRTFQPQASTLDLTTPDFSTMNFSTPDYSTMNFWTMGMKSSWLKNLGLKCHLSRRLKDISTPDFFNRRLFNHEIFNPMVQKFMVEKSRVEKSGVEKFMVEKSGVERSEVEACGWKVRGWDVFQPIEMYCIWVFVLFRKVMNAIPIPQQAQIEKEEWMNSLEQNVLCTT